MSGLNTRTILYGASVMPLADKELYMQAYRAASPQRRQKIDRFYHERDRRLSLGAWLLLRCGLQEAGLDADSVMLEYSRYGKPYLKAEDIFFSISHTGDFAVCAISPYEVGCDVEKIERFDLRLADRFFSSPEYEDIAAQSTFEAQKELFYRYWTLKESFQKVTGLGMSLPLNAFTILRGSEISVIQKIDNRKYLFKEFLDIPDCRCALCVAGDCGDAVFSPVDLSKLLSAH